MRFGFSAQTEHAQRRKIGTGLWVAAFALLLLFGFLSWAGWQREIQAAENATRNYANIVETRLDATLRRANSDMREVTDLVKPAQLNGDQKPTDLSEINDRLRSRLADFPESEGLRIFNRQGDAVYFSDDSTPPATNVADREHFRLLRDDPTSVLRFSDVITSRITGRQTVLAARSIRDRQGAFQGIIVASINLGYFRKILQSLNIGPGAVVAVYRSDTFRQVLRWPDAGGELNSQLPMNSPTRQALPSGKTTATIQLESASDGIVRIYSYQKVEPFPFFVSVGMSRNAALANWMAVFAVTAMLSLLLLAILVATVKVVFRTWDVMKANNALMRSTFAQAAVGIAHFDPKTLRILIANDRLCQMLGYTREELVGMDARHLTPTDELPSRVTDLRRFLDNEIETSTLEQRLIRKNGDRIWINRSLSLVRDENGQPDYFISVIEDITTRKAIERELKGSRALLESIIDSIPSNVFAYDLQHRLMLVNAANAAFLGKSKDELLGRTLFDVFPEAMAEKLYAVNLGIMSNRTAIVSEELMPGLRGEEPRLMMTSRFPLIDADGALIGLGGVALDVTEKQRDQKAIQEANDRLAAIIDASMDAIIAVDDLERIVIFSKSAEKMFHMAASQALGKSIEQFIPPRFRAKHHVDMARFGTTDTTVRAMGESARVSALRADGTEFPVEAAISHMATSGRQIFTVTIRDISERSRAEAIHESLEAQLRESQKMQAVGTLAGGIAHDFNNIIAIILGNAELLSNEMGATQPESPSLAEIRKAGRRARELVQQILSFSRRQPTELRQMSIAAVVEDSEQMLRAVLPARIVLEVHCAPDLPMVMADPVQIQQILVNLATNSMQAIQARAGRIRIRVDAPQLSEAMVENHPDLQHLFKAAAGRTVRLTVSDDGPGMSGATLSRVFEPFFTTKPTGQGTGLGLSVVHGIVQTHKGVIQAESEPGKGTTFTLYLAAAGHNAAIPAPPMALQAVPFVLTSTGKHILYVDDDEALVFLIQRLLERRGYEVTTHTNPIKAIQTVKADPDIFDLVVTDYNMPEMSGLDLVRALRAIRADLPVAIMSGFIDEQLLAHAGSAGVQEVVFKAAAVEDLCEVIERLITSAATTGY